MKIMSFNSTFTYHIINVTHIISNFLILIVKSIVKRPCLVQMQADGLYNMPHGLRPPSMAPPGIMPNFSGIRQPSALENVS